MAWNARILEAVSQGLQVSAAKGHFVPYQWVESFHRDPDGGCSIRGCGWGLVGWYAAVMLGGVSWAQQMMPVDATQEHVNAVLKLAGLTDAEIESMDPEGLWTFFDENLDAAYDDRFEDPDKFIALSLGLADVFVEVTHRVPVADEIDPDNLVIVLPATSWRDAVTVSLDELGEMTEAA